MRQLLKNITLDTQGLGQTNTFRAGLNSTLEAINTLSYIQIDSLSVVTRAHHHTLWNRVSNYQEEYLNTLVSEGSIFEHWFHAAAYLPMQDYRFALPRMEAIRQGKVSYYNNIDKRVVQYVHDRIHSEGPLKAKDFKSAKTQAGTWWNWKPAKQALERLFMQGDLMIVKRDGLEKVYDLRERALPDTTNTQVPTLNEVADYLINCALKAYGLTTVKQITHLRSKPDLNKAVHHNLQSRVEEGELTVLNIKAMPAVYIKTALLNATAPPAPKGVKLLSPFDNAVIHRDRLAQLFEFDYKLECYVTAAKRQYGYFCLPILYKNDFIGRVDCKAHRDTGVFKLINLYIETTPEDSEAFVGAFIKTIKDFADFNSCQSILIEQVQPVSLKRQLTQALNH